MKSINNAILVILFCAVSCQAWGELDNELNNGRCGGPIEADSGRLTYPLPSSRTNADSDELCIWTINLKSTSTFRLNFSNLNVSSNSESCEDNAVRIYSLSNLIPADSAESYTFCNNKPPSLGASFFLSQSLITVIYRSQNSSNSGFTLNWEGVSVQPIEKTHESTYSTASSGLIRYPVSGNYSSNHISTWLVNSGTEANQKVELNFPYVQTEPCARGVTEDCLCDAVVLYQVQSSGQLEESARLCGNLTNQEFPQVSSNFILGFFSDHEKTGNGKGFEAVYTPNTKPPTQNTSSTCGGILSGDVGLIEYKLNEVYDSNERCIWTIRSEGRTEMTFTVNAFGMYPWYDTLEVLTMDTTGNTTQYAFSKSDLGIPRSFNATVAIVCFYTTSWTGDDTGFSLSYQVAGDLASDLLHYKDEFIFQNTTEAGGVIKYPAENGQQLRNGELSTFVVQHQYANSHYEPMSINVTALNLERESGNCRDWIRIFRFHSLPGTMIGLQEISRWPYDGGICQMDELPNDDRGFPNTDHLLVVFLRTDNEVASEGFEIRWQVDLNP